MKTLPQALQGRRHLLKAAARLPLLAGAGLLLAACGGGAAGDDDAGAPAIELFAADRDSALVGERATLRVRYSGGTGRIEPGIGAVASGSSVDTGPLEASRRWRLVVSAPGRPDALRELALPVRLRGRMQAAGTLAASMHAAVDTADGGALVLGGSRGTGVVSWAIDRYDAAGRQFVRVGDLLTGRAQHSAVRLDDGRVLVFGGVTSTNVWPFAELVDERTGASTAAGTMQQARIRHAAARLADGRVLAIGGSNRNTVEIWSPATRTWRLVTARMAHVREYPTATLLADGRVLIVGGDGDTDTYVWAEVFDPTTETFTPVPGAPAERRWLHAAARLADGTVWVAGGDGPAGALHTATWRVTATASGVTAGPAWPTGRSLAAAALTPDDDWLLFGGQTDTEPSTASAISCRGAAQAALPALPGARLWHTATRLRDGRVLVVGGEDHDGQFAPGAALYD